MSLVKTKPSTKILKLNTILLNSTIGSLSISIESKYTHTHTHTRMHKGNVIND